MSVTDAGSVAFVVDVDRTLVTTPLVTMIAASVDLVDEVEVLDEALGNGRLPFERSIRLLCRLLSDVPVSEASRRVSVAGLDGDVLEAIATKADRCWFVTGLPDCWTGSLGERLPGELVSSTATVVDDRLVAVDEVLDKAAHVRRLRDSFDTVVAVGSGLDDLPMFEAADVRVVFGLNPPTGLRDIADFWVTSGRALCQLLRPL